MRVNKGVALSLLICIVLIFGSAAAALSADAANTAAKPDWRFHSIVDIKYVMRQIHVPMPENVVIIDSRPQRSKYDKGHIPMAVNIPARQFDRMTDRLPADKNALLIFYCGGPT